MEPLEQVQGHGDQFLARTIFIANRLPRITRESMIEWRGCGRTDLPAFTGLTLDGAVARGTGQDFPASQNAGAGGVPPHRIPIYEYVDTNCSEISQTHTLYTDSISWCCGVAFWTMGKAGLFHVIPGGHKPKFSLFMNRFSEKPTEIYLATQQSSGPSFFADLGESTANRSVLGVIDAICNRWGDDLQGGLLNGIKIFIVTGYAGHEWNHRSRLAVDPKTGIFATFEDSDSEDSD